MRILKINIFNWAKKLIKLLKIIYFFITLDFSLLDFDEFNYLNNLSPEEKIIIGIVAFLCTGIFIWTVTHDEDFEKKLKELDDERWKKEWWK